MLSESNSNSQSYKLFRNLTGQEYKQRYRKQQKIGNGTYGDVFLGLTVQGREVAVKQLRDNYIDQKDIQEVQSMQKLKHQNILSVIELCLVKTTQEKLVIVTEYCKLGDLSKCKYKLADMDQQGKLKIVLQIAKGVAWIHSKNYMHRDIKPENILLTDDLTVKICDFGFVKHQYFGDKSVKVGTPSYTAPEVKTGSYTKRCDVYSVGLVIYYIFVGKGLFQGSRSAYDMKIKQETFFKHKQKQIEKLNIPTYIKQILYKTITDSQTKRCDSQTLLQLIQTQINQRFPQKNIIDHESKNNSKRVFSPQVIFNDPQISKVNVDQFCSLSIFHKNQLIEKKQKSDNTQKLLSRFHKRRQQMQNIKILSEFSLIPQAYKKEFLLFLILILYLRQIKILKMWIKKQVIDINYKQEMRKSLDRQGIVLEYDLVDNSYLQMIEKIAQGQQMKFQDLLVNLSYQLNGKLKIIQKQISPYARSAIRTVQSTFMEKIQSFTEDSIKTQYKRFILQHCKVDLTQIKKQTNIQNYKIITNFMDNL